MLVTAVEARPLRSLERRRGSSSAPGIVSVVGPNGAGKTNLLEALYFALTGRSFRTSDRRDLIPFGGSLARAEATVRDEDGIERTPARLGQPRRGPPPPARRQPGRPGDAGPQPPAGGGLLARPAGAGQGPAGRAPRPPRRLRRRPLAGPRRSCASASARRWRSATRCSPGSPPGYGAAGRPRRLGRAPGRGRGAAGRGPRRGGRPSWPRPFADGRRPSSASRAAPRSSTRRGRRARREEIRAGLERAARARTSAWAAAPGARTSTS